MQMHLNSMRQCLSSLRLVTTQFRLRNVFSPTMFIFSDRCTMVHRSKNDPKMFIKRYKTLQKRNKTMHIIRSSAPGLSQSSRLGCEMLLVRKKISNSIASTAQLGLSPVSIGQKHRLYCSINLLKFDLIWVISTS